MMIVEVILQFYLSKQLVFVHERTTLRSVSELRQLASAWYVWPRVQYNDWLKSTVTHNKTLTQSHVTCHISPFFYETNTLS